MKNRSNKKVVIVGAGLVGSLLGVMLGQRGYHIDLFERRSDGRKVDGDSGRSINLALSSRGIYALQKAGLYEEVQPLLIPMKGRMLHPLNEPLRFSPYGQRAHEIVYSVPRDALNRLMADKAVAAPDVNVRFEQKCSAVDFENRVATFESADGSVSQHSFELLIGSDGAGSRVRRELVKASGGESRSVYLEHDYKELEIPAAQDGVWEIEKEALHIWPRGRFMLIALPNPGGSFTVTLFLPKTGELSFESLQKREDVVAFFNQYFPTAMKLMPDLVRDFFDHETGRLGTVRCSPFHFEDRGLIVGDAAHAIVPFHGQGMNSGFEDCSELIRLLDVHDENWGKVLPTFTEIRKPNADAIADMAIENHEMMQKGVTDPKYHLKKELGFELERRYPDLFIPRYSRVMFHITPYAQAMQLGQIQRNILDDLTRDIDSMDEVDFELAASLIDQRLVKIAGARVSS